MSTNNPSLVVQRLDRATDLVVSAGLPVKCLVFPATGGLQAIDAAGNILPLVGPSGSLIPSADNVDDLGTVALRWRKLFIGTSIDAPLINAGGSGDVDLVLSGTGNGVVNPQSPLIITPTVRSGNAATTGALEVIGAANTAVLASTEAHVVNIDLSETVQFATGPKTTQRAMIVTAPTYTAVGATVIDDAATVAIAGAPIPLAPLTITRTHALWVQSGMARFDGAVVAGSTLDVDGVVTLNSGIVIDATVANPTITSTRAGENLRLRPTTTGAVSLQGSGGASIVEVSTVTGASLLGFYNIGPVARQVLATGGGATVDQVITALQNLGLLAQA